MGALRREGGGLVGSIFNLGGRGGGVSLLRISVLYSLRFGVLDTLF